MKKQKLEKLFLKKQVISKFDYNKVVGGLARSLSTCDQKAQNQMNEIVFIKKCCYEIPPNG
ncbi:hypothetical protein [Kordia sp.]|uniref:hypothetical protein n=1 Tax=Kordia sp. TaxID=1965332 RepID=UPI003D6C3988